MTTTTIEQLEEKIDELIRTHIADIGYGQTVVASPEVADTGYAAGIDLAVRANFSCS